MPIYEYRCQKCGERFEDFRSIHASDDEVVCPRCGATKPKRLLSAFSSPGGGEESGGNLTFPTWGSGC
jgi:putative FmdB family regulatory protein